MDLGVQGLGVWGFRGLGVRAALFGKGFMSSKQWLCQGCS